MKSSLMTYKLTFLKSAKKEWDKLGETIQRQLKIEQRLQNPHAPKDALHGMKGCYKIKLRASGYRLVYRVFDERIVVQVVAIGKRNREEVYRLVFQRLIRH